MFPTWSDWDITYTRKGLIKTKAIKTLRMLAIVATVVGFVRLRKNGQGVQDVKALLKGYVRNALLTAAAVLQIAGSKV